MRAERLCRVPRVEGNQAVVEKRRRERTLYAWPKWAAFWRFLRCKPPVGADGKPAPVPSPTNVNRVDSLERDIAQSTRGGLADAFAHLEKVEEVREGGEGEGEDTSGDGALIGGGGGGGGGDEARRVSFAAGSRSARSVREAGGKGAAAADRYARSNMSRNTNTVGVPRRVAARRAPTLAEALFSPSVSNLLQGWDGNGSVHERVRLRQLRRGGLRATNGLAFGGGGGGGGARPRSLQRRHSFKLRRGTPPRPRPKAFKAAAVDPGAGSQAALAVEELKLTSEKKEELARMETAMEELPFWDISEDTDFKETVPETDAAAVAKASLANKAFKGALPFRDVSLGDVTSPHGDADASVVMRSASGTEEVFFSTREGKHEGKQQVRGE
jgi:hypothetical protein